MVRVLEGSLMVGMVVVFIAMVGALLAMHGLPGRWVTIAIPDPTPGALNLTGDFGRSLARGDLEHLGALFSEVRTSESEPPRRDVLLLHCRIQPNGDLENSGRTLRELIKDSGASAVVIPVDHPGEAYIASAAKPTCGLTNLVMTLDRRGDALPKFLAKLVSEVKKAKAMPIAWSRLASQRRGADHGEAPDTIFSCELGPIAFR